MSAFSDFTAAARSFAAAASAAASANVLDPSVLDSLNKLPGLCQAAIAEVRSENTAPEAVDKVRDCEELLFDCSQLGDALLARQSTFFSYVVPADVLLIKIAEKFYGGDAVFRVSEIEGNNPAVFGVVVVPAYTILRLAPATV